MEVTWFKKQGRGDKDSYKQFNYLRLPCNDGKEFRKYAVDYCNDNHCRLIYTSSDGNTISLYKGNKSPNSPQYKVVFKR